MQLRCAFVAINAHYAHTSLALRQLRAHAPECAYFEFHLNQPFRTMADALIEYAPALVGLSCYIWNVDMALRLARALKAALPGVIIAAGGPEVERDAAAYLRAHPELDYILEGEGERLWPGLISALNQCGDACGKPGVWARSTQCPNCGSTAGAAANSCIDGAAASGANDAAPRVTVASHADGTAHCGNAAHRATAACCNDGTVTVASHADGTAHCDNAAHRATAACRNDDAATVTVASHTDNTAHCDNTAYRATAACRNDDAATVTVASHADNTARGGDAVTSNSNAPGIVRGPALPPSDPTEWRFPYAPGELRALRDRLTYIETSRGCPFSCAYCLSRGQGVRMLDAERAAQWLIRMADEGARTIKLVDRTFNADDRRAIHIWDALIQRATQWPQHPVFHFEITARLLSEEALNCLERAPDGLFQLEIGIQTTAPEALRAIDRPDDYRRIAYAVQRLMRRGNIHVHADLIAGLPGETPQSLGQSFNDAWRLGADMVQLGFLKLLRGSELRAQADALGLKYDPDPPYEIESTPTLPASELICARRIAALVDQYHNSGRYRCTLRLLTEARQPWHVFDALRRYWDAHGLYSHGLSPAERTAALYRFGLELGTDAQALGACIRHDCIARGGRLELPSELAGALSEADRAILREYVHPVRGQWIEHYPVDIAAYARGGDMRPGECAILYDPAREMWFALDEHGPASRTT